MFRGHLVTVHSDLLHKPFRALNVFDFKYIIPDICLSKVCIFTISCFFFLLVTWVSPALLSLFFSWSGVPIWQIIVILLHRKWSVCNHLVKIGNLHDLQRVFIEVFFFEFRHACQILQQIIKPLCIPRVCLASDSTMGRVFCFVWTNVHKVLCQFWGGLLVEFRIGCFAFPIVQWATGCGIVLGLQVSRLFFLYVDHSGIQMLSLLHGSMINLFRLVCLVMLP